MKESTKATEAIQHSGAGEPEGLPMISEGGEFMFPLRTGTKVRFKHFALKDSNLVKLLIHINGKDGERVWACLSDSDLMNYKENIRDKEMARVANIQNCTLHGVCAGEYLPYRLNGSEVPSCDLGLIDTDSKYFERFFNEIDREKK